MRRRVTKWGAKDLFGRAALNNRKKHRPKDIETPDRLTKINAVISWKIGRKTIFRVFVRQACA